jgi:hypothetical protein
MLVLGYLLATFTIWLAGVVGAIYACLIVAAIFALVAVVLHLVAASVARRHRWNLRAEIPGFFAGSRGKH